MTGAGRALSVLAALALILAATATPGAAGAAPRAGGLSVSIVLPVNGSVVKGDVNITGNASGPGGVALSVQLSIDGGPWYPAEGNLSWTWLWSTFAFEDGMSVVQALTLAGGFTKQAAPNSTSVTRHVSGQEVKMKVNVQDIALGKSANFKLEPGDIVYVPESMF